jgi:hypothetical protein
MHSAASAATCALVAAATAWLKALTVVLLLLLLHNTCGTHSCYAAATLSQLLLLNRC